MHSSLMPKPNTVVSTAANEDVLIERRPTYFVHRSLSTAQTIEHTIHSYSVLTSVKFNQNLHAPHTTQLPFQTQFPQSLLVELQNNRNTGHLNGYNQLATIPGIAREKMWKGVWDFGEFSINFGRIFIQFYAFIRGGFIWGVELRKSPLCPTN